MPEHDLGRIPHALLLHAELQGAGVDDGALPGQIAQQLKGLIQEDVVAPMRAALPFLGESLRVL